MKLIAAALALFFAMTVLSGDGVNGLQCCAKSCGSWCVAVREVLIDTLTNVDPLSYLPSSDWYDNCGSSPRCTENKCPELNKPKKDCGE